MSRYKSTLGEIVKRDDGLIQTGPFGSQLHQADYVSEGIPVVMPKDIADGRITIDSIAQVTEETANRLERHKLRPRSIVLPRRGEVTKRAYIRAEQDGWLCGTGCLKIEVGGQVIIPEFLYYYMEQGQVIQWLEQHAVGTTMLNLSASIVADLPIEYPSVDSQVKVAAILSAYDDLIENNRRRMALLEDAARQLYREWFVRLRFPGYEHTRIVDSVPEGWERKRIGDIADCVGGGTPSTTNPSFWEDGEVTWVTPTDVTRNKHFILLDSEKKITAAGLQGSSAKLVPHFAVLMTSRASVGFFAIAGKEVCTNQGFISIVPSDPVFSSFLLFQLSERVEEIRSMGSGSTYPEVSRGKFREFEVLVPAEQLVAIFSEQTDRQLKQIRVLKQQNEKLRAARDLLLPRLMNGEIVVSPQ